jgi:hypothetical protein
MITYFQVNGCMYSVDPGVEHRLRGCVHEDRYVPQAFEQVGLGADFVDQWIR